MELTILGKTDSHEIGYFTSHTVLVFLLLIGPRYRVEPLILNFLRAKCQSYNYKTNLLEQDRTEEVERAQIVPSCWCTRVFGRGGFRNLALRIWNPTND